MNLGVKEKKKIMQNIILTVSREWASGGHTVAELAAKELGIPCYDTQIIQETAKTL